MHRPRLGKRRKVYQNRYHQIYRVRADFGDFAKEYFVSDYGQRVGLLIWWRAKVLLVRQYRLLINAESWEIPGGKMDGGESPKRAAAREALEETGLLCRNLRPLLYLDPGLDTFHNPTHIFETNDFRAAPPDSLHKQEISGRAWFPLTKCLDMIFSRKITDSLSVASLLAFHAAKTRRRDANSAGKMPNQGWAHEEWA